MVTVFSGGLWGVSWLALVVSRWRWPFQCRRCGARITVQVARRFEKDDGPSFDDESAEDDPPEGGLGAVLQSPAAG
jgi:hypothetical protein